LDDDGNQVFSDLAAGNYAVTENVPAGWDLDSVVCTGGDSTPIQDGVTIHLDPGEEITCTFNNIKLGTIIVEKQTDPDGAAGTFTFSGVVNGAISDNGQLTAEVGPGT
jgi:hypothetical protein